MRQWVRLIVGSVIIFHLKIFTAVTKRPRVRVLVVNEKQQLLLIRTFVSHGNWTLPGGGMKSNERPIRAAKRELFEETGIDVDESQFEHLTTFTKSEHNVPFTAPLFRVKVDAAMFSVQRIDKREVAAARWFDANNLPVSLSTIALLALEMHKGTRYAPLRR